VSACVLLSGCGLADSYTMLPVPAILRREAARPSGTEYPDVRAIAKASGRNLFSHKPDRIFISTPVYDRTTATYSVCAYVNDASRHPPMTARIIRGTLVDRRSSIPQDGCGGQEFEEVVVD
jgi:hypothetical protein